MSRPGRGGPVWRLRARVGHVGWAALVPRVVLWLAASGALLFAWRPAVIGWAWSLGFIALAGAATLGPGGPLPATVMVLSATGWYLHQAGPDQPVPLAAAGVLAVLLYLTHSGAALAAVVPYDTDGAAPVVRGWLRRTALVLGMSAVLGLVLGVLSGALRGSGGYLAVTAAGLVALAGLVWYLSRRVRAIDWRRPARDRGRGPW